MYLQVINKGKTKHNTIQSTDATLISDIKRQGWNVSDCKVSEIRAELIDTKYRGTDGKNVPPGRKQYKTRAAKTNTLNRKTQHVNIEAIVS